MLTRTQIRTLARKFSSDTDATNPFWADADVNILIENWQVDMASYLRYPRGDSSVITQVVGTASYDLPADWLSTIRIVMYETGGIEAKLIYQTEDQISERDPNWRNQTAAERGTPRYYFTANTITPGTTLSRKFYVYPTPDKAYSMLMVYVKNPTAIAADANIPIFPAPMHMLAAYYCAWQMLLPLNLERADYYSKLYEKERRRMCGEGRKESDTPNIIQMK